MIFLETRTPTSAWIELGKIFFDYPGHPTFEESIDYKLGDRRFVSLNNTIVIREWPKEFTGDGLFKAVGYSSKGYKMDKLRKTYVDEDKFQHLIYNCRNITYSDKFTSMGMNFNMSEFGKGGCLSSFHTIKTKHGWEIFVHGKIMEVPRKIVGDLRLIHSLLLELPIREWPVKVTLQLSAMYYSIVGLRSYIPILGKQNMEMHGLPIDEPRNYQASIIKQIYNLGEELVEEYGQEIIRKGCLKEIDLITGEFK